MGSEQKTDEAILQALSEEAAARLSADERAALKRILARLEAAEKACALVRSSLKFRRTTAERGKRVYWWDVAIALDEWAKLAKS